MSNQLQDEIKEQLKILVSGTYQLQKLRIQTGNRIVGNFKVKLGQAPGEAETNLEEKEKKLIEILRKDYESITAGVVNFPTMKKFKAAGVISTYSELCMLEQYFELEKSEEGHFKRIEQMIRCFPIWTHYLKGVKGIGPALAGIIITNIDISKATYPSSLWKLAGIDVAWDGKGRSKRKEHLIEVEYTNREGKRETKKSITYKPMLKTKLTAIASAAFLRAGKTSTYAKVYYDYKHRLENHPRHRDTYIALDIESCKAKLGSIPKKFYTRSYLAEMYERCSMMVREQQPNLPENQMPGEIHKFYQNYLGQHVIVEDLIEQRLAFGTTYDMDELSDLVKAAGGVLRKPKKPKTVDPVQLAEQDAFNTQEEEPEVFDDTPDRQGRKLYKPVNVGKSAVHRHRMACRYSVKMFLSELYRVWREMEGLPVMPSYAEAKLGLVHGEASPGKVAS